MVQHAQGVVVHRHIDAPQSAPGAADGVEIATSLGQQFGVAEGALDGFAYARVVEAVSVGEREWTQRKCLAAAWPFWADLNQLQTGAAQVADNAFSVWRT